MSYEEPDPVTPAEAWDAAVDEAYHSGWLHDVAYQTVKARNPYRPGFWNPC